MMLLISIGKIEIPYWLLQRETEGVLGRRTRERGALTMATVPELGSISR